MSHAKGRVPVRNLEFLEFAQNIINNVTSHPEWNIDEDILNAISALSETAHRDYEANANPEMKNKHTSKHQKHSIQELRTQLSAFINLLLGTPEVPDENIAAMGLRRRRRTRHEPLPPPGEMPELKLLSDQGQTVKIFLSSLRHGHPAGHLTDNRRHYGFILRYRMEDDIDWTYITTTRKTRILTFPDTAEGKRLYAQAAWLSPRLEQGPWSNEVKIRLQ